MKVVRKIQLKLSGGLGNQLWQLAFAYTVMKQYDYDIIEIDDSYYQKHNVRSLELLHYELPNVIYKNGLRKNNTYNILYFLFSKIRGGLFLLTNRYVDNYCRFYYKKGYVITHNHAIYLGTASKNDNIIVSGYFQDIMNISETIPYLKKIVKVKKTTEELKEYKKIINESSAKIALSIRCGDDYSVLGKGICDNNYYLKALKYLGALNKNVFVFSDDIQKAKEILKTFADYTFFFIPQFSAVEQLELLKECNYHILSNSTFSYWGYLLSDCVCGVVPSKWFPYLKMEDAGLLRDNLVIIGND